MDKILCHIVGINDELKKKIINLLNKENYNIEIIDLDQITQKIINDRNMNMMYNKFETLFQKSKENLVYIIFLYISQIHGPRMPLVIAGPWMGSWIFRRNPRS